MLTRTSRFPASGRKAKPRLVRSGGHRRGRSRSPAAVLGGCGRRRRCICRFVVHRAGAARGLLRGVDTLTQATSPSALVSTLDFGLMEGGDGGSPSTQPISRPNLRARAAPARARIASGNVSITHVVTKVTLEASKNPSSPAFLSDRARTRSDLSILSNVPPHRGSCIPGAVRPLRRVLHLDLGEIYRNGLV